MVLVVKGKRKLLTQISNAIFIGIDVHYSVSVEGPRPPSYKALHQTVLLHRVPGEAFLFSFLSGTIKVRIVYCMFETAVQDHLESKVAQTNKASMPKSTP